MPTLQQYANKLAFSHRIDAGCFRIEPRIPDGVVLYDLTFNGVLLATYHKPQAAADDLHAGTHDAAIGFSAGATDLPVIVRQWNDLG